MNPATRTVALVGRPNVGKSRLFNRLARRRIAIVLDHPGVTRDVNSFEIEDDSGSYTLLDTGGIGLSDGGTTPRMLIEAAEAQVFVAVEAATLICFVVDARDGLTAMDEMLAERLRKSGRPILLVVNKVDGPNMEARAHEFARLGFGPGLCVSAEHGYNESELRRAITEKLPPCETSAEETAQEPEHRIRISFIGRPNVGKSSLCNALLKSERLVVSEVPGTTRDTIELNLDYTDKDGTKIAFRMADTAGLRRRTRVDTPMEIFSAMRSKEALEKSDVAFVVLDALEGVTKQEQMLLGKALEAAPAVVVLVNKWDHAKEAIAARQLKDYQTEREYREDFERAVREELFFLPESPILFVSAKTGYFVDYILKVAATLDARLETKLSTPAINRLLEKLFQQREPARRDGKRFKAYYATQTYNRPFTIRIFCNSAERLDESYRRYLERGFMDEFSLQGCPLKFVLTGKPKRERTETEKPAAREKRKYRTPRKRR